MLHKVEEHHTTPLSPILFYTHHIFFLTHRTEERTKRAVLDEFLSLAPTPK